MLWMFVTILPLALTATGAPPATDKNATADMPMGFIYKTVTVENETYAYSVYVPPTYRADKPWPMILFLHGSGERGEDGFKQTEVGIGRAIRLNSQRVPAIVVMPQCRRDDVWWSPKMTDMVLACLNETGRQYHLDPQQLYLTGLSLGGGGCWHFGALLDGRFAAIAPICAIHEERLDEPQSLVPRLAKLPLAVYHGALDQAVPVTDSRRMVQTLTEAGAKVRYTEYEDGTHGIWDRVYADAEFWNWLFAQHRAD